MLQRIDVDAADEPLIHGEAETPGDVTPAENTETQTMEPQNEGYNPNFADHGSPISKVHHRQIDLERHSASQISTLDTESETPEDTEDDPFASSILDYFNETALKSKKRNALPDDVFGLPRTRQYPLNDKAHVQQAIRMFGHCKDPKDRETLAKNIFKAMEKFNVTTKIGKSNALYEYAPEALRETKEYPRFVLSGLGTPMNKRTKADVIAEHLRMNRNFYNNVFYGFDFARSIKALKEFTFLDYFHPDLYRMAFQVRLQSVCGGMASANAAGTMYHFLGIRAPQCLDFDKPLGQATTETEDDRDNIAEILCDANYNEECNWFHVSLADDVYHNFYCMRLYSVMGEIVQDPNFDPEVSLTPYHYGILADWKHHVQYHYDLYLDAEPDSKEQHRQMQYLWDLFWSCTDNPADESIISTNIISMVHTMASVRSMVINMNEANVPGEIVSKEQCSAYLVKDLGMSDDLFLLPDTLEYPIVDKTSIRLAMDMIWKIPDADKPTYVKRLNQKYREFGCDFAISVDHPYAPYADKTIVDHMAHLLLEGDTAVADDGTSVAKTGQSVTNPWYKRLDYVQGIDHSVLDDAELGPNKKKQQEPDYTPHDSVL
ncbi:MAG: hypothetical protein NC114_09895 [Ruminococcus flavefaciens]|nr:hypothetical protein [Ruminococcus flavefaciens]